MVLAALSLFFSCKKEDDKPTGCLINTANISGSYKLSALEYVSGTNVPPIDFMPFLDDCEKDDILTFGNNGIYHKSDAGTVCDPSSDDEGSWKLEGNTITMDGDAAGAIASFDCKTLVYYVENSLKQGDKMTITYIRQ